MNGYNLLCNCVINELINLLILYNLCTFKLDYKLLGT